MSGIFGIYHRRDDGRAVETLRELTKAMSHWQPDASGTWARDAIGLGHLMCWNTPESSFDTQPRAQEIPGRTLVLTADARLDNRRELYRQLRREPALSGRSLETIPDSGLLLAAYGKWGTGCPARLLGDFAFALWDAEQQRLFCARDHLGMKTFYYHLDDRRIVFANDIGGLAGRPGIGAELDEVALGKYLRASELFDAERTFIKGISKLPPATWLCIGPDDVRQAVYWRPEDSAAVRLSSTEAYSDALRELLEDAVRVRLRTAYPVASHLSGGLDSGLVTGLAAEAMRERGRPLYTYNWVQAPEDNDDPECAEWTNSDRIAAYLGVHHEHIDITPQDLLREIETMDLTRHATSDVWYENSLRARVARHGVRTILSGWGGDELISQSGRRRYTGDFWRGRPLTAVRELYRESREPGRTARKFARRCYRELLMPSLARAGSLFMSPARPVTECLACARPEFAAAAGRLDPYVYFWLALDVRSEQLALLRQGHLQNRTESWTNAGRPDRVEYRYPLLDKRVVEFALGLPRQCYRQDGFKRYLARHAAGGLMPEEIRWQSAKREPRRVTRLLDMFAVSFQDWLTRARPHRVWPEDVRNHRIIDVDKLAAAIDVLKADDDEPLAVERLTLGNTILRSILVLRAGHSHR